MTMAAPQSRINALCVMCSTYCTLSMYYKCDVRVLEHPAAQPEAKSRSLRGCCTFIHLLLVPNQREKAAARVMQSFGLHTF